MSLPFDENPFGEHRLNDAESYRPEWDVPSVGAAVSAALGAEIERLRTHPQPESRRKICAVLGQPGHGKTHLFGRLMHEQGSKVLLVFAPQSDGARQPDSDVQWRLVETLFQPNADGVAPLQVLFAQLLRPSFEEYFEALPTSLQARHAGLLQRVRDDWRAVLEVLAPVATLPPYQTLARSLAERFPALPAATLQALALGLSPAADEVRRWLRGEILPDDQLAALKLPEKTPTPGEVLRTVAVLLAEVKVPLLVCLDQLELLLGKASHKVGPLTSLLMGWLQEIPNLLLMVGCLSDIWSNEVKVGPTFKSFLDRVQEHSLQPLTGEQAVELLKRRLKARAHPRGPLWPFEEADVKGFVEQRPTAPRGFLQHCGRLFEDWSAKKADIPIALGGAKPPPPLAELFQAEWAKQYDAIQKAGKAARDYQEEELWEACKQGLLLAGQFMPANLSLLRWQEKALRGTPTDRRPSAEIQLGVGKEQRAVVLAVSKKDAGPGFGFYVEELERALGGTVVGAVLVWPAARLGVGHTSKAYQRYQSLVSSGKVRPLGLDAEAATFHRLECLRRVITMAQTRDLQLGGKIVSLEECRKLIVETKQLEGLKLFEFLFTGWPEIDKLRAPLVATSSAAAPAPPPKQPPPPPAPTAPAPVPVTVAPPPPPANVPAGHPTARAMLDKVVDKLRNYGQPVKEQGFEVGPTFIRLKVAPQGQTDFNKVRRQADNLKLHLGLTQRPIIETQAGYISIDVQRPDRQKVPLPALLASRPPALVGQPAFPAGVDVAGKTHWINLAEASNCHLLIAGTTGSGKSEFMKAMLAGLADALGPDQLQVLLIDPKQVTFNFPQASPYLFQPVAHDREEALPLIEECVQEMEDRYSLMQQRFKSHVSELAGKDSRPWRVVLFDEFADLMIDRSDRKTIETQLKRIGAKARAAGIHLVLGTQRPEATVVTPLLRSNLPGRISLQVLSEKDSKLILDTGEAAHLLGKGDLLCRQGGGLVRLQSPLVSQEELLSALRCH